MKKLTVFFLIAANVLCSCEYNEKSVTPDDAITAEKIAGTWLAVSEKRLSDNWAQSDENGITTDWGVKNPLSNGGFKINAIKLSTDGTFVWNITNPEHWEHWLNIRADLPRDRWSTYTLHKDGKSITLYTPFEYVGIISVDTTEFEISIVQHDRLILKNQEVRLEFIDTLQY